MGGPSLTILQVGPKHLLEGRAYCQTCETVRKNTGINYDPDLHEHCGQCGTKVSSTEEDLRSKLITCSAQAADTKSLTFPGFTLFPKLRLCALCYQRQKKEFNASPAGVAKQHAKEEAKQLKVKEVKEKKEKKEKKRTRRVTGR